MSRDIQQQKHFKVLLMGDSCIDKFHYGTCERISPEAPVPILLHEKTIETGGMANNVYNNLLAFGSLLQIDVLTNQELIIKERFIDSRSGQHIMRFDFGDSEKVKSLDLGLIEGIRGYDLVIVSDYNKGFIEDSQAREICRKCTEFEIPVFVDTKKNNIGCYQGAYVKVNKKESKSINCIFNEEKLIITLGPEGALWRGKRYETNHVQVSDVSGAGDTFLSVLSVSYLKNGNNIENAIVDANRAASFVVQKTGTYSLKERDIENLCI